MAFAEIHTLVAVPFAAILPIFGIAGSCVLVRYKDEYVECQKPFIDANMLANNGEFSGFEKHPMKLGLRLLPSLIYAYSISYFFFIQKSGRSLAMANCIIFELLNILLVAGGIFTMVLKGSDECSGKTYGSMVTALAIVSILSGLVELILHTGCFFHYQANNKLPFMSPSGSKGENAV